jgi:ferredoxin-thioredoxin reductase catalytic subunit
VREEIVVSMEEVESAYQKYRKDAENGGYYLNPDVEFTRGLVHGLLVNEKRYGYPSCPCRLAAGRKEDDLDIICPCDYRDQDITDYGACYCGLYVSYDIFKGNRRLQPIPERRLSYLQRQKAKVEVSVAKSAVISALTLPVWRCKVCGYLCAREGPPDVCPICKAKKERFERFI